VFCGLENYTSQLCAIATLTQKPPTSMRLLFPGGKKRSLFLVKNVLQTSKKGLSIKQIIQRLYITNQFGPIDKSFPLSGSHNRPWRDHTFIDGPVTGLSCSSCSQLHPSKMNSTPWLSSLEPQWPVLHWWWGSSSSILSWRCKGLSFACERFQRDFSRVLAWRNKVIDLDEEHSCFPECVTQARVMEQCMYIIHGSTNHPLH